MLYSVNGRIYFVQSPLKWRPNKDVHMSVADIERIITDAYLCGFQEIVITGGEPLMHKDRNLLLEKLAQLR